MLDRRAWVALAPAILASLPLACSLAVDLEGYSGGTGASDVGPDVRDTGADAREDSKVDTVDAADTGSSDTGTGDTGTGDTGDTAGADTGGDTGTGDTGTDGGTDTGSDAGTCHPVINEVVTGLALPGSATDELIEVYNPCATTVSLAGWKLAYRSSAGASESTLTTLSVSVPAGGYLLFASTGGYFSKAPYTPDGTFSSGLAGAGGGVGLRDDKGALVDALAWGDAAAGHPFVETTKKAAATTSAPPGQGLARTPNGKDTNDNSADFAAATPTPKAAN